MSYCIKEGKDLKFHLKSCGYPNRIVHRAFKQAQYTNRERCLFPEKTVKDDKITCVTTYSPISNDLRRIVKKHWHFLKTVEFNPTVPRFAFKRQKNYRDLLDHSYPLKQDKTTQSTLWNLPQVKGHHKCGQCSVCELTKNLSAIDLNGKMWQLHTFTTCATDWVIYGIKCPCSLLYIGKTTRPVRQRICEQRSCLKNKVANTPLVAHFE